MIAWVFVTTLLLGYMAQFIWYRWKVMRLRGELGLSGPPAHFLLGNLPDLLRFQKERGLDQTPFMRVEDEKIYGKVFGWYFGGILQITTSDIDFAKEVMITQFHNFVDRETISLSDTFPMRDGLLQISSRGHGGVGWKDVRSVVSPIFTSGKMKKMHNIVLERVNTCMDVLSQRVGETGGYFDIYDEWQSLTLDSIARCAFGEKCDSLRNRNDTFYVNCQTFFREHTLDRAWFAFTMSFVFPSLGPYLRSWTKFGKAEKVIIKRLRNTLEQRKKNEQEFEGVDLIDLILEQNAERQKNENKPPLSDDVIISNCYSFLLAGYETTSTALAYCSWLLAKHTDVQQRLYEEIVETFGEDEAIDYERVMRLKYCDAVFLETLRVYPPVVFFTSRCCIKDTVVRGQKIPKGVFVNIPVQAVHWNEDYWQNPMQFDPERFTAPDARKNSAAWMPFGMGPRNCVGIRFAEMEFKTAIVALIRRFQPSLRSPNDELKVRVSSVLMRPMEGVHIVVEERKINK